MVQGIAVSNWGIGTMDGHLGGISGDEVTAILRKIASRTCELGGSVSALREATARLHRELGYTWVDDGRMIEIRITPALSGYLCYRRGRMPVDPRHTVVLVDVEEFQKPAASVEHLPWHILPPGEHPFPAILEHLQALAQRHPTVKYDYTRLEKLNGLGPTSICIGTEEFDGYFVFCFQQYFAAVLDCPMVGNAVYLMRENDWSVLCRLTKAELLTQHRGRVRRIVHAGSWFERLRRHLTRYRNERSAESSPR